MSIKYNSHHNSNFNNDAEFVNINLLCNKLGMQLLVNNSTTRTKKHYVNKTKNEANNTPTIDIIREKRV